MLLADSACSPLADHPRIVVVGTSACGKRTFCRQLAERLGRPHIELDALYWGPNWTPNADFAARVEAAVAADEWLVDGNYFSHVRALVWRRATAVVWLNYSFPLVMSRALARTCRRIVSQEPLFADNRESALKSFFTLDGIPWWVLRTFHRRQRELRQAFREPEFSHLAVIELRRPREAERLIALTSPSGSRPK